MSAIQFSSTADGTVATGATVTTMIPGEDTAFETPVPVKPGDVLKLHVGPDGKARLEVQPPPPAESTLVGIEELRSAVEALNGCREDFLWAQRDPFTAEQLLTIWRAWKRCDWDFYPDQWTPRQVREALTGKVPQWCADAHAPNYGKPVYDAPEYTVRAHDLSETVLAEHVSIEAALAKYDEVYGHATVYDDETGEQACMMALGQALGCDCPKCEAT